jgi:TRAP-type C4-dicarboxylate transport system substrate-binding protein
MTQVQDLVKYMTLLNFKLTSCCLFSNEILWSSHGDAQREIIVQLEVLI